MLAEQEMRGVDGMEGMHLYHNCMSGLLLRSLFLYLIQVAEQVITVAQCNTWCSQVMLRQCHIRVLFSPAAGKITARG